MMPLTMNIHHAVADGYHLFRYFIEVQKLIGSFQLFFHETIDHMVNCFFNLTLYIQSIDKRCSYFYVEKNLLL